MDPRRQSRSNTTPAQAVQQILGNAAFEGVLRQSTLRPMASEPQQASRDRQPASRDRQPASRDRQPSEELAAAFPSLYRASSSNTSHSSGTQSQQYPYNPQRNYNMPSSSRRAARSRSTPYSKSVKTFVKTVVLVDPVVDVVPKGKRRQQACDDGCVVDMMEFRSDWGEGEIVAAIEAAFAKVLASGPSPK